MAAQTCLIFTRSVLQLSRFMAIGFSVFANLEQGGVIPTFFQQGVNL